MTEPVGQQITGQVATFHVEQATGRVVIDWPNGRPEMVEMTTDMLEAIVDDTNRYLEVIRLLSLALAGAMHGRRPNPEIMQRIDEIKERFGIE